MSLDIQLPMNPRPSNHINPFHDQCQDKRHLLDYSLGTRWVVRTIMIISLSTPESKRRVRSSKEERNQGNVYPTVSSWPSIPSSESRSHSRLLTWRTQYLQYSINRVNHCLCKESHEFASGNKVDNFFGFLANGPMQDGVAPFVLICQMLISHEIGKLWGCGEKLYGFMGPEVTQYDLDDLSRQKE